VLFVLLLLTIVVCPSSFGYCYNTIEKKRRTNNTKEKRRTNNTIDKRRRTNNNRQKKDKHQ
jgi:preprotein translocase subunit Sec63